MKTSNHIIASSARGFACAGMATIITALFSWSFVASTDTMNWMGSGALHSPEMAMTREDTGPGSITTVG